MKKIVVLWICLSVFFVFGCKNNDNFDFEEVDIEDVNDVNTNISDDMNDVNSIFEKGKAALEAGNINEAIEKFNEALKINDNADWVHGDLGRAKKENGDFDGAIDCYTKAIELNDKRSVYYYWRAEAYEALGNAESAQKDKEIADELHDKGMD